MVRKDGVDRMKAIMQSNILKQAVNIAAETGPEIKIAVSKNGIRFVSVGEDGVSAVVVECKKPAVKTVEVSKDGELYYLNSSKLAKKIKSSAKSITLTQEKNSGVLGIRRGYLNIKQPLIKTPDYAHTPVKQFHEGVKTVLTVPVTPLHELFEVSSDISDCVRIIVDKNQFSIGSTKTGDSAKAVIPAKKCKKFKVGEAVDLRVTTTRLANFLGHASGYVMFYLKNDYPVTTEIKVDAGVSARQIVAPRGKEK